MSKPSNLDKWGRDKARRMAGVPQHDSPHHREWEKKEASGMQVDDKTESGDDGRKK